MPASRTSAATPAAPGVYVVTAADFVSGSATIAARHSFSFSMPTGGVSIPVPVVAASDARAGSTSGSPTRSAARPHRKRAREYVQLYSVLVLYYEHSRLPLLASSLHVYSHSRYSYSYEHWRLPLLASSLYVYSYSRSRYSYS